MHSSANLQVPAPKSASNNHLGTRWSCCKIVPKTIMCRPTVMYAVHQYLRGYSFVRLFFDSTGQTNVYFASLWYGCIFKVRPVWTLFDRFPTVSEHFRKYFLRFTFVFTGRRWTGIKKRFEFPIFTNLKEKHCTPHVRQCRQQSHPVPFLRNHKTAKLCHLQKSVQIRHFDRFLRFPTCCLTFPDIFRSLRASQRILHFGKDHFAPIPPQILTENTLVPPVMPVKQCLCFNVQVHGLTLYALCIPASPHEVVVLRALLCYMQDLPLDVKSELKDFQTQDHAFHGQQMGFHNTGTLASVRR